MDATALSPVYSFLSREDHEAIIEKVHKEEKSSVVLTDELIAASGAGGGEGAETNQTEA